MNSSAVTVTLRHSINNVDLFGGRAKHQTKTFVCLLSGVANLTIFCIKLVKFFPKITIYIYGMKF